MKSKMISILIITMFLFNYLTLGAFCYQSRYTPNYNGSLYESIKSEEATREKYSRPESYLDRIKKNKSEQTTKKSETTVSKVKEDDDYYYYYDEDETMNYYADNDIEGTSEYNDYTFIDPFEDDFIDTEETTAKEADTDIYIIEEETTQATIDYYEAAANHLVKLTITGATCDTTLVLKDVVTGVGVSFTLSQSNNYSCIENVTAGTYTVHSLTNKDNNIEILGLYDKDGNEIKEVNIANDTSELNFVVQEKKTNFILKILKKNAWILTFIVAMIFAYFYLKNHRKLPSKPNNISYSSDN